MADEILQEIWRIKDEYAARFNYDLHAMFQHLKEKERESGRKYVRLVKRLPKARRSRRAASSGDYRDELERLIRTKFGSREAFCCKAGIAKAGLVGLLEGKQDLPVRTLMEALARIGYTLHIGKSARRSRASA